MEVGIGENGDDEVTDKMSLSIGSRKLCFAHMVIR
jgi:hypothetical protein